MRARIFLDFLKRLVADVDRNVILLVDGPPTHRAKLGKNFVEEHNDAIELVLLPPYSP